MGGFHLPGSGEQPAARVFVDGEKAVKLRGPTLTEDFRQLVVCGEAAGGRGAVVHGEAADGETAEQEGAAFLLASGIWRPSLREISRYIHLCIHFTHRSLGIRQRNMGLVSMKPASALYIALPWHLLCHQNGGSDPL